MQKTHKTHHNWEKTGQNSCYSGDITVEMSALHLHTNGLVCVISTNGNKTLACASA